MKLICVSSIYFLTALITLAQGTVNFANRVQQPNISALVTDDCRGTLLGASHLAQLYAGPAGAAESSLAPFGSPVAFRVSSTTQAPLGWFSGGVVTITGIPAGGSAVVQVRAWEASGGATYEAAMVSGKHFGKSELLHLASTGNPNAVPPTTPVDLVGLRGFSICIPEPSALALAALGAAFLWFWRRRS